MAGVADLARDLRVRLDRPVIGRLAEGRRPSLFKDLRFLLIGPLWLLAAAYRRLGLRY